MDLPSQVENFKHQLSAVENSNTSTLKKSQEAIMLCRDLLSGLKQDIKQNPFTSIDNEIGFFKETKQIPLSNLIYHLEIYAFESLFLKATEKMQQKLLEKAQNKAHRFFIEHLDFINYIEQGQTHLDAHYFTRNHSSHLSMMQAQDYFFDMDFNTSHDLLLGKTNAFKRFSSYLANHNTCNGNSIGPKETQLKWTSSKVALTELIYALYHSRVINYGNSDIKDIAMVFQNSFNFELGDFYKTYSDIRGRKNDRTKFLDELSMALTSEMELRDS